MFVASMFSLDDGLKLVVDDRPILDMIISVPFLVDIPKPPGFTSVNRVPTDNLLQKIAVELNFKIALTPITSRGFWRFWE